MKRGELTALILSTLLLGGCVDFLDPGDLGTPRYFGEIRGEVPLRVAPPITDRAGNVYVTYGSRELNLVEIHVGHLGGGWTAKCSGHRGDSRGFHGWIGRARERAWYWSGDALVEVSGVTGGCDQILDRDPSSNAVLDFLGAVPLVRETPSRTYTVALLRSPGEDAAFFVEVDLGRDRYFKSHRFEPAEATSIEVLGVGADPDSNTGFMLVRYLLDGVPKVEGLYLDMNGNVTDRVEVPSADGLREDAVLGYLHSPDGELVIGLVETDQIVIFHPTAGSQVRDAGGMEDPAGVHRWKDELYLVGENGGGPAIARIGEDGRPGAPELWEGSVRARNALRDKNVIVLDDRSEPMQEKTWASPSTAIGRFPFVSALGPEEYAVDTTSWLIAGPSFNAGGERQTSVAFAPIGISYP